MLKIFHARRTRSLRILWLAEEMGLAYEVSPVEFGQPKPRELVAANPSGTLPAIVDGEVVMTESVAILQYLCDRYGPTPLSVKPDQPNYADYLQFLVLGEAGLAAPLNAAIACRFYGAPEDQDSFALRVVHDGFLKRLKLVSRRLETHPYMAGDDFTAADISVAYALPIAEFLGLGDRMPDSVKAYNARVTARPAYQRAAAV